MTEYALSATFRLYEEAGAGEHRTLVLARRGPGDHGFVMLSTPEPIVAGQTFTLEGALYRLIRPREVFEGWDAEVVRQ